MGKDRVEYGRSRRFAQGSQQVERSIGITTLSYFDKSKSRANVAFMDEVRQYKADILAQRPVALMKWAFDDFIVKEVLPPAAVLASSPPAAATDDQLETQEGGGSSLLVPVVSEGIPDDVVEAYFRHHISSNTSARMPPLHFLSPVDFSSCSLRHVWLRGNDAGLRRAFSRPHLWRTPHGPVYTQPALRCAVPAASVTSGRFPLRLLPDFEYTVLLRNAGSALGDVLPRLRHLRDVGFLNYSHIARHGVGTLRSFEAATALLQRDYRAFLAGYVRGLTESTPFVQRELPSLLEALQDGRASAADWKGVLDGLTYAVRADAAVVQRAQTGLYSPHHELLLDFVTRAADLAPRRHDSAQLVRECVSRGVLLEKMQSLSEVYFNALASIRWEAEGGAVAVGDVVAVGAQRDSFEGAADHVNGNMTSSAHPVWTRVPDEQGEEELVFARDDVRVVGSPEEARRYSITDVLIPYYGRGCLAQFGAPTGDGDSDGGSGNGAALPLPRHRAGLLFHKLATEMQLTGAASMRTAPAASYRHLLCRPRWAQFYLYDEVRGWEWEEPVSRSAGVSGAGAGAPPPPLKSCLYRDQEGIARVSSPLRALARRSGVARSGIRGDEERGFFAKPARKGGMTCVVQMQLPRGSPVTSALREVFQLASLQPSGICQLLKGKP